MKTQLNNSTTNSKHLVQHHLGVPNKIMMIVILLTSLIYCTQLHGQTFHSDIISSGEGVHYSVVIHQDDKSQNSVQFVIYEELDNVIKIKEVLNNFEADLSHKIYSLKIDEASLIEPLTIEIISIMNDKMSIVINPGSSGKALILIKLEPNKFHEKTSLKTMRSRIKHNRFKKIFGTDLTMGDKPK